MLMLFDPFAIIRSCSMTLGSNWRGEGNCGESIWVCFANKSTVFYCDALHFAFVLHFAFADNGEGAPLGYC